MKKNYTAFLLVIACHLSVFSQSDVVQTGFDNYDGASATEPSGWYMSWHSVSVPSYYSTAGSSGAAVPSYKMGVDSVVIITPMYQNSDTLSFWCKGNGVPFAKINELHIYHSADSITWNVFVNRDSLPASGTTLKYGLPSNSGWLMFVYRKYGSGNLAFDDVIALPLSATSVNEGELSSSVVIYPNPSNGQFTLHGSRFPVMELEIYTMVGEQLFSTMNPNEIDIPAFPNGIYFLKLKTDYGIITKKIIVLK